MRIFKGISLIISVVAVFAGTDAFPQDTSLKTISVRINSGSNDAEERVSSKAVYTSSSDLELAYEGSTQQIIGLRFTSVAIPKGATITKAHVQFTADEISQGLAQLVIKGQTGANPVAFSSSSGNLSGRPKTIGSVLWSPPEWLAAGAASSPQRTPDLKALVQEVVNGSTWISGNSLALFVQGSGKRVAEAYNGSSSKAPLLVVEYSLSQTPPVSTSDTTPPVVSILSPLDGQTISGLVAINANATDDVGVASVNFRWDGEAFSTPDMLAPFSFSWDTVKSGDDLYTLTAVATDTSGNTSVSPIVTVRVQNSALPPAPVVGSGNGAIRRVPQDYSSIQAAINASLNGDTVLVSPGTYSGTITLDRGITLASLFHSTGDRANIDRTILSGGAPIVNITSTAANAKVIGFTLKGGTKGIQAFAHATVENNKFMSVGNDAMSIETTSGIVRNNYFEFPGDDCIDVDDPRGSILVEGNLCKGADDDGIEIRNYNYAGAMVVVMIRSNTFSGAENGDGIQLIDYSAASSRKYIIQNNLLISNNKAGLGLLDNGDTVQDFRAASMPERIEVINNTIVGNSHGISGGDNLIALNNIIANNSVLGIKGADNKSIASYNIFYGNGANYSASNVNIATSKFANPMLGADYRLLAGSPAIDAGIASFSHNGEEILNLPSNFYSGTAPDLGSYESSGSIAEPTPVPEPVVTPPASTSYVDDTFISLTGGVAIIPVSKDFGYSVYKYDASVDGKALALDMRLSTFIVANSKNSNPTASYDCTNGSLSINTYPALLYNADYTAFVGGLFDGSQIPQLSDWRPSYCNSAALSFRNTPYGIADGVRITGAWDAVRQAEGSKDLLLTNTWMSNVRDDGVENDFRNNLFVRDVLMDGVFQAISVRVASSNTVADSSMNTVVVSGSVIRLQPYLIEGEYAFGALFKTSTAGAPKGKVYNTVLALDPENAVNLSGVNWPQGWKDMVDCKNNVFLWMSNQPIPSNLGTIPSCFQIVKGQAARDMFNRAKTNWINCHPRVARAASDPLSDINQCRANEYGGFGS